MIFLFQIQHAVANKDYKLCTILEATLKRLEHSREKLPVPVPPLTRVELLDMIAKKQVIITNKILF